MSKHHDLTIEGIAMLYTIELSTSQLYTIRAALEVATMAYHEDAAVQGQPTRITEQFRRQEAAANSMLETLPV